MHTNRREFVHFSEFWHCCSAYYCILEQIYCFFFFYSFLCLPTSCKADLLSLNMLVIFSPRPADPFLMTAAWGQAGRRDRDSGTVRTPQLCNRLWVDNNTQCPFPKVLQTLTYCCHCWSYFLGCKKYTRKIYGLCGAKTYSLCFWL